MHKPPAQKGDRPKVQKTYRLDADLVDAIQARSMLTGESQIEIVEKALRQYLNK